MNNDDIMDDDRMEWMRSINEWMNRMIWWNNQWMNK